MRHDGEATTPIDSSGTAVASCRLNGLNLLCTSGEQCDSGTPVVMEDLQKGDPVFFATSRSGRVSQVGISIGKGKFIHARGRGKTICADALSRTFYRGRFSGARTCLR